MQTQLRCLTYGHFLPGGIAPVAPIKPHPNDIGNSHRFCNQYGDDLRYVPVYGKWLVWNGQRWLWDDLQSIKLRAKDVAKSIYKEASYSDDADQQKLISNWARQSGSLPRLECMIAAAQSDLAISPEDLDTDDWLLNCENGTIDLRTGNLIPHDRNHLITKIAPVKYIKSAPAPRFRKFLEEILPNPAVRDYFQRVIGYSLTGSQQEQKFFLLTGDGANGKSTVMVAISLALGDYKIEAESELLLARKDKSQSNDVARLKGARLVLTTETDQGRILDEGRIKRLTGGDKVAVRFLYKEAFEFFPTHTLFLITNHKPTIKCNDFSMWRRVSNINFGVTFDEDQQDKTLPLKLKAELEGILAWAVEGCLEWQRDGLKEPPEVKASTDDYRMETDQFHRYLSECCINEGSVTFQDLYKNYSAWCDIEGELRDTEVAFAKRLKRRGLAWERPPGKPTVYFGISLKESEKGVDP